MTSVSAVDPGGAAVRVLDGLAALRAKLPPWLPWFLGRLLSGLGVVLVISFIVFGATQALPSDPARIILGPEAPEHTIAVLRTQLGLDQPLIIQYFEWGRQVLSGNLGRSIDSNVPVGELMAGRFANSLSLTLSVALLAFPLSLSLGIFLALRRDTFVDRSVVASVVLFKAVPGFVIGIWLVMIFSTSVFNVLPAASLLDPALPALLQPEYLILPTLTLALSVGTYLLRLVRASMIEAMESEYVIAARLKGVPERRIIWRHAVPNALIPAIQGVAMTVRALFGGAVLAEVIFSYPGIGNMLNAAIEMRDLPLIQGIVLVITVGVVVINLAADLITVLLTPRLRTASRIRARSPGLRRAMALWRNGGGRQQARRMRVSI
jgi:peptide/nickel transport system permease protein